MAGQETLSTPRIEMTRNRWSPARRILAVALIFLLASGIVCGSVYQEVGSPNAFIVPFTDHIVYLDDDLGVGTVDHEECHQERIRMAGVTTWWMEYMFRGKACMEEAACNQNEMHWVCHMPGMEQPEWMSK